MLKLASLVLVCVLSTASVAAAATSDAPAMLIAGPARAPLGYMKMCRRHPGECPSDGIATASTSQAGWAAIFDTGNDDVSESPGSVGLFSAPRLRIAMPTQPRTTTFDDFVFRKSRLHFSRRFWADQDAVASQDAGESGPAGETLSLSPFSQDPVETDAVAPEPPDMAVTMDIETRDYTAGTLPVQLLATNLRQVRAVNARVNRSLRRASDREMFGRDDFWAVPEDGAPGGDCEDYVLAKRHALVEAGVPVGALSIALVRTRPGDIHAVLLVATPNGEVVMDNLAPQVLPWRQTPYDWLSRQASGSAQWVRIGRIH